MTRSSSIPNFASASVNAKFQRPRVVGGLPASRVTEGGQWRLAKWTATVVSTVDSHGGIAGSSTCDHAVNVRPSPFSNLLVAAYAFVDVRI